MPTHREPCGWRRGRRLPSAPRSALWSSLRRSARFGAEMASFCVLLMSHAFAMSPPRHSLAGEGRTPTIALLVRPGLVCPRLGGVPALGAPCPDADRVDPVVLELVPERPYRWIHSPGERIRVKARSRAASDVTSVVLTVWDWEERPVAAAHVPPDGCAPVELRVEGRGTYVLTLDALGSKGCVARLVRSIAVCPSSARKAAAWRGDFWVGQCSFPAWQGAELVPGHPTTPPGMTPAQSRALDAELVARMGVGVARINLDVARRDAAGMDLDFGLADACVSEFTSRGLRLDLQLFPPGGPGVGPIAGDHPEAGPGQNAIYPMAEMPYRHYVREVARRYGRHALFFQVGNEPGNLQQYRGTAAEYVAQFGQAADEIRRVCPGVPVTNGGYCVDNLETQAIVKGLGRSPDFASYHWHGALAGLNWFRERISAMHRDAGIDVPPLANTEMGYAMPTVGQERENAVLTMQKLLTCWAHGHKGVLLYSSRELWWPRQFSLNGISDYGFVDYFYCPRFVYGAVSAFLDSNAGFRMERVLPTDPALTVVVLRRGSRRHVVLFAPDQPVDAILRSVGPASETIDAMGNVRRSTGGSEVRLRVGAYPVTVVYTGRRGDDLSVRVAPSP